MPPSKKTMSKTRQLSALVNFVSGLRANRVKGPLVAPSPHVHIAAVRRRLIGEGHADE